MEVAIYDAVDHDNLSISRARGVTKRDVADAIEHDGTLVVRVSCSFVVHHAAWAGIDEGTLAGLINRLVGGEHVDPGHIDRFKIIEANRE